MKSCGFQPRGPASQVYSLEDESLCLIATSEITLAALYKGATVDVNKASRTTHVGQLNHTRHTSHLTPHTSHLTHHTSHLTPHTIQSHASLVSHHASHAFRCPSTWSASAIAFGVKLEEQGPRIVVCFVFISSRRFLCDVWRVTCGV